jgi:hypothetical protein
MEHTTYASRLRYLNADDVDDAVVDYDGLDVRGPDGSTLGDLDGFIVDAQAGRVHYLVVDSGGWFRSRRFLLPVGHATLGTDRTALEVDVTRDALKQYPEFDQDVFNTFSDDDLRLFETRMTEVCCPDVVDTATWTWGGARHFSQPDWWAEASYPHERLRPVESAPYRRVAAPSTERFDREQVTARERSGGEVSPHFEGRAQPGDVIGIETGGERSYVGDTTDDENRRRERAERALIDEEPRQSER